MLAFLKRIRSDLTCCCSTSEIVSAEILLMPDDQIDITEYRSIKQKFETAIKEPEAETKPQPPNTKDYKQ